MMKTKQKQSEHTFTEKVSLGPQMYPDSFNCPTDTSSLCRELEASTPKPLFSKGKGEDEGYKLRSSSPLHEDDKFII